MTQADDIRAMLADSETLVTYKGEMYACDLMTHDVQLPQQRPGAPVQTRNSYIQCSADDLAGIKTGDALSVNGTNYQAAQISMIQDGLMLQVWLKAEPSA